STAGSSTAATTIRDQKELKESGSPAAESPLAGRVLDQSCSQVVLAEVRPRLLDEDELRVRELPEQEVRDPLIARRTDQQIGIGQIWLVQRSGEGVFIDLVRLNARLNEPLRRVGELGPAAVVEGDPEVEPIVRPGSGLEIRHLVLELLRSPVAAAEESDPDALPCQIGQLAVDRLAEDLHQAV